MPQNIRGKTIELGDLADEERKRIYGYYAPMGTPLLDLGAFPTPQDVKVAAQAAAALSGRSTPAAVYDTYVRLVLGQAIASVGTKVCRRIAHHVFRQFSPFLSHEEFDALAEDALSEFGAPVAWIERIKATRLFEQELDGISFSHDLLVNHLVAADIVHSHRSNLEELPELLDQPLYRPLVAEVVSRIATKQTAVGLLLRYASSQIFESAYLGYLGEPIREGLFRFLEEVLQRTEAELDALELDFIPAESDRSYPCVLPHVHAKPLDADFCALPLIINHLKTFLPRIAEVFRRYGDNLLTAIRSLARTERLRQSAVLDLFLREEIVCSPARLRCSQLTTELSALCETSFEAGSVFNPILDYVTCTVWERRHDPNVPKMLGIFRKCWESNSHYLRLRAIDMFQFQLHWLTEQPREIVQKVVSEIESRLGNDAILNTSLFEILSRLGELESPVSKESAQDEVSELLAELQIRSTNEPDELGTTLAERASSFVGKIFEEIFMGSYFPVFDNLCPEDKATLLNAAAMDLRFSFNHDFFLAEIVKLKQKSSKKVFQMFCCRTPKRTFQLGQEHRLFAASVVGLAAIEEPLPEWVDGNSSPCVAWKALREIFYCELTGRIDRAESLWKHIESEDPLGRVSALLQLRFYANDPLIDSQVRFLPEEAAPLAVKRLLEIGLKNWRQLDLGDLEVGVFSHNPFGMVCDILARIGGEQSVSLLEAFTRDAQKGSDAIRAIRAIKQRLRAVTSPP